VACHFAGEIGHHPAQPVTAPLYAEGTPSAQANRLVEVSSEVGFTPRWLDLPSGDVVGERRKVTGGGAGAGEDLAGQG
jgi:peptide/nickel transport system ATP-binding protein/oligopeptide transport system ATP-binding protein